MGRGDDDDTVQRLLIARRRIVETAQAKISLLHAVLTERGPKHLTHALIYASAKNPEQFEQIGEMLGSLDIRWAPVTQDTTSNPKLLNETLSTFEQGGYQVLLAKKVLDEGVDIPSIREAFIVASSTVQREWIQRRGRVLRRSPGKQWALVHDFIALPPASLASTTGPASARKIIRSELDRAYSFAAHARNAAGDDGVLTTLETIRGAYWPQAGDQRVLQHPGDYLVAPSDPPRRPVVSNYDRIFQEITSESQRLAPGEGVDPDALVRLVMEIVDLEDQHRTRSTNIKQLVEDRIYDAAMAVLREGE